MASYNEFNFDKITIDDDLAQDLSVFGDSSGFGGTLMSAVMQAGKEFYAIQGQKEQNRQTKEAFKINELDSIEYDKHDPQSMLQAEKSLERMGAENIQRENAPVYVQSYETKYNRLKKDQKEFEQFHQILSEVDKGGDKGQYDIENYTYGAGKLYSSLEGQDLYDAIEQGKSYYHRKIVELSNMKRLDPATQAIIMDKITELERLETYVGAGGTVTPQEMNQFETGMNLKETLDLAYRDKSDILRQMTSAENELTSLRATYGDPHYIQHGIPTEIKDLMKELEQKYGKLSDDYDAAELKHDRIENELTGVYTGGGGDPIKFSGVSTDPEDLAGNLYGVKFEGKLLANEDISKNNMIQFGTGKVDGSGNVVYESAKMGDFAKDIKKLQQTTKRFPSALSSSDPKYDEIQDTAHKLNNISKSSPIWDYDMGGGVTLRDYYADMNDRWQGIDKRFTNPPWKQDDVARYTIKKGDTLSSVAEEYGVTTDWLRERNPQIKDDILYRGDKLHLPKKMQVVDRYMNLSGGEQDEILGIASRFFENEVSHITDAGLDVEKMESAQVWGRGSEIWDLNYNLQNAEGGMDQHSIPMGQVITDNHKKIIRNHTETTQKIIRQTFDRQIELTSDEEKVMSFLTTGWQSKDMTEEMKEMEKLYKDEFASLKKKYGKDFKNLIKQSKKASQVRKNVQDSVDTKKGQSQRSRAKYLKETKTWRNPDGSNKSQEQLEREGKIKDSSSDPGSVRGTRRYH